jgi:putative transposase
MYAIKRELKLNNKEASYFCQSAGYSRFVYNFGLAMMKGSWSFCDVKASDSKRLGFIKKVFTNHVKSRPEFSWCNDLSSRIYQNAFMDLGDAFGRYRKGLAECPVFKSKRHQCSFTVDSSNGLILVNAGKTIKIPTLGKYRLKEAIPANCMSQTFTISREAGKWFVSFMVNAERIPAMQHTESVVGIDLGIKCFATLSDGSVIESPKSIKQAKSKLRLFQFRNRNKQIGSRRKRIKTSKSGEMYFQRLRKKHFHIVNIREDFLQKETTRLAKTYQEIKIEDLNIKGMMANRKLSEAIGTLGLYRFRELLGYKQAFHGFMLTIIDRWFPSSRMCSDCGHKQDMPLKERIYQCGGCGAVKDRDLNASLNIKNWPTLPMAIGIRTPMDCARPTSQNEVGIKQLSLFV